MHWFFLVAMIVLTPACAQRISGDEPNSDVIVSGRDTTTPSGKKAVGVACTLDSECDSGACQGACIGPRCARNSDCGGGLHCIPSIVRDGGSTFVEPRCGAMIGSAALGEPCATNDDCVSGYCEDLVGPDYCSSSCTSEADCPDSGGPWICAAQRYAIDASQPVTVFPICQKTAGTSCSGSADCDSGSTCRAWLIVQESFDNGQRISGSVESICGPVSSGGGASDGQTCDATDPHACKSGLCLTADGGTSYFCAALCVDAQDCASGLTCIPDGLIVFDQNTEAREDDVTTSLCIP